MLFSDALERAECPICLQRLCGADSQPSSQSTRPPLPSAVSKPATSSSANYPPAQLFDTGMLRVADRLLTRLVSGLWPGHQLPPDAVTHVLPHAVILEALQRLRLCRRGDSLDLLQLQQFADYMMVLWELCPPRPPARAPEAAPDASWAAAVVLDSELAWTVPPAAAPPLARTPVVGLWGAVDLLLTHAAERVAADDLSGTGGRFSGHASSGAWAAAAAEGGRDAMALLPCGHLMHWLCAAQCCEFSKPSCPVCRHALPHGTDSLVLFQPQPRPPTSARATASVSASVSAAPAAHESALRPSPDSVAGCGRSDDDDEERVSPGGDDVALEPPHQRPRLETPATPAATAVADPQPRAPREMADNRNGDDDDDGVMVTGFGQRPPAEVYLARLRGFSEKLRERATAMAQRNQRMSDKLASLRAERDEMQKQASAAERSVRVLTTSGLSGGGGDGGGVDPVQLRRLRENCRDLKRQHEQATEELATEIRRTAAAERQLAALKERLASAQRRHGLQPASDAD